MGKEAATVSKPKNYIEVMQLQAGWTLEERLWALAHEAQNLDQVTSFCSDRENDIFTDILAQEYDRALAKLEGKAKMSSIITFTCPSCHGAGGYDYGYRDLETGYVDLCPCHVCNGEGILSSDSREGHQFIDCEGSEGGCDLCWLWEPVQDDAPYVLSLIHI